MSGYLLLNKNRHPGTAILTTPVIRYIQRAIIQE